ncbi:hypothetical protein KUG02_01670 [Streptococcus equi subsp. zooepidemicus]|uniref:Uncharacterized protein n=2 Tax=Streptococcus TaxID=1301 RepID=A0A0Z8KEZ3_STRSU|nr:MULTISPECIES: hypothetical protein [Streptococcus]WHL22675.1 hypothetical protein QLH62_06545 [Streptococcus iniae]MCD3432488.1 hypothetical protein [Streptococcus equi subsp. zooepidemicus]NQG69572.1 hypothetical protein [Streptococcus suis]NQI72358.1 hypothetical protein [Streptococcus suis]WAI92200.1 hypothetical protein MP619_06650 [Streptococcus dysgalactiae]
MAQKTLRERLDEKEIALEKAEKQKQIYTEKVTKLKAEVRSLKADITLELLTERNLDLDDLELFIDDIKGLKDKVTLPDEATSY